MSTKTISVDIWGHHHDEPSYQNPVNFPFEVDTPNGDTGTTYIRYLDRDITSIHKISVTEGESRTAIVRKIAFGSWTDRESLDYLPPESYPRNIILLDEESESDSGSESGSEPESGSESESGSVPDSGSESDSGSAPGSDSGSEPESTPESDSAPESGSEE